MNPLTELSRLRGGRMVILFTLSGLLLVLCQNICAEEENTLFASFQQMVRVADPRLAQATFKEEHSSPPTQEQMQEIVGKLTSAAVNVMDQAKEIESRFPQSSHLLEVHRDLTETLTSVFGSLGLP